MSDCITYPAGELLWPESIRLKHAIADKSVFVERMQTYYVNLETGSAGKQNLKLSNLIYIDVKTSQRIEDKLIF